jgi:hypothetical protein
MKFLFLIAFMFTLSNAQAMERKLVCKLSLPSNQKVVLEDSIKDGEALVHHEFRMDSNSKTYEISANVWGFEPNHSNRVAGYLSFEQKREDLSEPMNYAINHCELKSYKEACNMELVAVLSGVGVMANCEVEALKE